MESMDTIFSFFPPETKKRFEEEEARRTKLREQMRQECTEVLRRVADAISTPNIARSDLEEAQKHVARALSIAAVLDPEDQ